ncbi:MAG: TfuA-related McrA-glycine thioamidation protein, partial [Methanoregula sp.]
MPRIIVFLGPSLDQASAAKILAAEYRPPAKRGDILAAVADGADIIGLIDGVFHQDCAVAHREILTAVKGGITVVGASSMGALRAAEMDTLGMTGIGRIYHMYKDGTITSDDEVALVFDPVSGYALSEPLINIRCTLKNAEAAGVITPTAHAALLGAARSVFYP